MATEPQTITLVAKFYKYSTGEGKAVFIVDKTHEESYRECERLDRKITFHDIKNPRVVFKHRDTGAYFIHVNVHIALFGQAYMQFLYYTITFEAIYVNNHLILKMKERSKPLPNIAGALPTAEEQKK